MDEKKLREFWNAFQKCNKEQKERLLADLSDEELLQIRAVNNPYRKPTYPVGTKFLEFSYINMPREYMTKFITTTMVGFMYKMATEFNQYNISEKYPSELEGPFAMKLNLCFREFNVRKLEIHYREARDVNAESFARWMRARIIVVHKLKEFYDRECQGEGQSFRYTHLIPEIANIDFAGDVKNCIEEMEQEAKEFCKQNNIKYESVYPTDVAPTQEELDRLKMDLKVELGVKKTAQEKMQQRQDAILDFLDYHFKYDPNNHVRCDYMPDYDDKLKQRMKDNPEAFTYHPYTPVNGRPSAMVITKNFEAYLVPPSDTFSAFNTYLDSNYEHLRQCTDDIYGDVSDFETAILAREVFPNEEKAEKWKEKYANEITLSCMRTQFGAWTLVDPWRKNREKIRSTNENNKLVDHIIKTKEEEERMGKKLLRKHAGKMPGNIIGKDVPFESKLAGMGVERFTDENKIEAKILSQPMTRSRRPRVGNLSTVSYTIEPEAPTKSNDKDDKNDKEDK